MTTIATSPSPTDIVPAAGTVSTTTPQTRWGTLGGWTGERRFQTLARSTGIWLGWTNCGKTTIAASDSEGFHFNFDQTRISGLCKCVSWPFIDASGRSLNDLGQGFQMRFDDVLTKVGQLEALASANQPRPTTIYLDTWAALLPMIKDWLCRKYGKPSWRELASAMDGRTMWEEIQLVAVGLMRRLNAAGYGVHWMVHLANDKVAVGDGAMVNKLEVGMSAGMWSALHPNVDFVLPVFKRVDNPNPGAVAQTTRDQVLQPVTISSYVDPYHPDLLKIAKYRVHPTNPLPARIPINPDTAMADLNALYDRHQLPRA